jgi:hypothetical protein
VYGNVKVRVKIRFKVMVRAKIKVLIIACFMAKGHSRLRYR